MFSNQVEKIRKTPGTEVNFFMALCAKVPSTARMILRAY